VLDKIHFPIPTNKQAQRLFHGRGHAYPGLEHVSIDWLFPVALIKLYKEEPMGRILDLASRLHSQIEGCRSVQVQYRYLQQSPFELLLGERCEEIVVEESGLKYQISLGRAQNTGLFLDMKNGRDWVQQHSQNKSVLNLFAYNLCFFGCRSKGRSKQSGECGYESSFLVYGKRKSSLEPARYWQGGV